jgi:hypothetical protein
MSMWRWVECVVRPRHRWQMMQWRKWPLIDGGQSSCSLLPRRMFVMAILSTMLYKKIRLLFLVPRVWLVCRLNMTRVSRRQYNIIPLQYHRVHEQKRSPPEKSSSMLSPLQWVETHRTYRHHRFHWQQKPTLSNLWQCSRHHRYVLFQVVQWMVWQSIVLVWLHSGLECILLLLRGDEVLDRDCGQDGAGRPYDRDIRLMTLKWSLLSTHELAISPKSRHVPSLRDKIIVLRTTFGAFSPKKFLAPLSLA